MADASSGLQNRWLLLIAIVLGLLVVGIYNAHIAVIRASQESRMVEVVQVNQDVQAGEKLTREMIVSRAVPEEYLDSIGDVILWKDKDSIVSLGGRAVNQLVPKGYFLYYKDVFGSKSGKASAKLGEGMVAHGIDVDPNQTPGGLSVNDKINLIGKFQLPGEAQARYVRIITRVRVYAIDGETTETNRGGRRYNKVSIEVTEAVSLQLRNVLSHMIGDVAVELCQADAPITSEAGRINPELKDFTTAAGITAREARQRDDTFVPKQ
jgi:Flp pilus assembly protein CpaB